MKIIELIDSIDNNSYYGEFRNGWLHIVRKMAYQIKECLELNYPDTVDEFVFTQIKEKFVTLRIYCYPLLPKIEEIIDYW